MSVVPPPTEFDEIGRPITKDTVFECHACGTKIDTAKARLDGPFRTILIFRRLCFTCDFWVDKIDPMWGSDTGTRFVAEGHHCHADSQGHADGSIFIETGFGHVIRTSKVWHQGQIPERFRTYFRIYEGRVLDGEEGLARWEAQEAEKAAAEAKRQEADREYEKWVKDNGLEDDPRW